ncbi:NmrA family NAD(P)-binding protein [Methanobacterium sp. ACI-7]|uniref:NmrA family NAD(P)-binding protein n=1 Tax=unclassified Methanobacterium TaxID=2627676 RepID=UPI0039C3FF9C
MKRILITGATGNVGYEVIRSLFEIETNNQIIAGVRNIDRAKKKLEEFNSLQYIEFDFEDLSTFDSSLEDIDTVFLLRPPHISDIKKIFKSLIDSFKKYHVKEVVFLSVQGAERSNIIPHAKIEKLIIESKIDHIFLRPGYFMQNLITTLLDDIKEKNRIFLPAGKAKFNWIDVQNIGETAAIVLEDFKKYRNNAFEINGYENLDFGKVAEIMSGILNRNIKYENPNLINFYRTKRREGIDRNFVLVMIMLHFLPRFGKDPAISNFYEGITGKKPTKLADFIKREKLIF